MSSACTICRPSVLAVISVLTATLAGDPAFAVNPAVDRYVLVPPAGLGFVSPSYTTPANVDGQAIGWTALTNISDLHPTYWTSSGIPVDLTPKNPSGFNGAAAFGLSGTWVVGAGSGPATAGYAHALLWKNEASTAVDLNPAGFVGSNAYGISGNRIVGSGFGPGTGSQQNALLWTGTAASYVNLNPAGFSTSVAYTTTGTQQVGYGYTSGLRHALLWSGSAASAVDLNLGDPKGIVNSIARNAGGNQQVGSGFGQGTGGKMHALLWSGSAASVMDLQPKFDGFYRSEAMATNGAQQVGYCMADVIAHAVLWSGTAASAVDLHTLLPSGFVSSKAWNIDDVGNVYGIAEDRSGAYHFVVWSVPEPSAAMLMMSIGAGALLRRNRSNGSVAHKR